jgi:hypothetical protein
MYADNIYSEHGQLRRPLAWSLGLHVAFAAFVVLYAVFVNGIRDQAGAAAVAEMPWEQPW